MSGQGTDGPPGPGPGEADGFGPPWQYGDQRGPYEDPLAWYEDPRNHDGHGRPLPPPEPRPQPRSQPQPQPRSQPLPEPQAPYPYQPMPQPQFQPQHQHQPQPQPQPQPLPPQAPDPYDPRMYEPTYEVTRDTGEPTYEVTRDTGPPPHGAAPYPASPELPHEAPHQTSHEGTLRPPDETYEIPLVPRHARNAQPQQPPHPGPLPPEHHAPMHTQRTSPQSQPQPPMQPQPQPQPASASGAEAATAFPPDAAGAGAPPAAAPAAGRRARTGSPIIAPGFRPAAVTVVLAALLAGTAQLGTGALAGAVVVLQALTSAGWYRLNGMWPARQGIALAFLAGVSADVGLLLTDGDQAPTVLIGAIGIWSVLSFVLQLRNHSSPDERLYSLTAGLAAAGLSVLAAGTVPSEPDAVTVGAAAVGIAALARAIPLPSYVSPVVALLAAAGAGVATGRLTGMGPEGALLGLAAGACALVGLRVASYDRPSRFVHMTAGVALPVTLAVPALYLLGRALV